ncbi:MAG: hypothetical protein KA163_12995 [Bacteroidia bacterium]|nr:hypothetical protein [Bacteroidia bacterium]
MKKLIILFCLLAVSAIKAQAPQYLNYQGIARDAGGTIITTAIGVKFEILQGSASGTVVYDETNTITPSSAGIFTTAIGSGAAGIGTFSLITWANGPYYIRVNIDPTGGTSYSTVGTSQLLSVPYALYAETAGNTQTVNISGSAVTGTYPNYTITAPGVPTASTGISISGGTITNTAPDQTVTLTSAGISSVSGTYPSYTIDVPPPALNYNTGTNVLTLTQGTAVATTTLVGAGSSTVSMFASGIASVNPVGAGNNFTVSVQSPSFTSVGATSVTGTYPNFVINSPGASTTIPTSLQINLPHTTSTLSANNFSITVAPTNITGAGVSGTYPNYTVNASPSTSITSGSANVVVAGSAPSYTISAATPTLQINSPNTITPLGLNNYSITVPPSSVGLTGVGVASVSGSSPNYTVTVPGPSLTITGNSITVTQGTVVSTKTIATSPWTYSTGVIHSNGSVLNDKVAIGQASTSSNLEVANNVGSTNTVNPVVAISNVNSLFNASSVLQVRNTSGSGAVVAVDNTAMGDGVAINLSNATNGSTALQVSNNGIGYAGYFANNNATSNARVLDLSNAGTGGLIYGQISNTLNTSDAFSIITTGSGRGAIINKGGTGYALEVVHNGTSGNAGSFNISNASNSFQALTAQTSGNGDALAAYNIGVGRALYASNSSSVDAALITNSGSGRGLYVSSSSPSNESVFLTNSSTGGVLLAQNNNASNTGTFFNTGSGRALVANNIGSSDAVFIDNSGTGRALYARNANSVTTRAALIGGGLDISTKTAGISNFGIVITNTASVNLFNVRDDGNVGIGYPNPAYRLAVTQSVNATSVIYANNGYTTSSAATVNGVTGLTSNSHSLSAGVMGFATGTGSAAGVIGESTNAGPSIFGIKNGSGIAGRFEIFASGSSADAVFASTNGTGAALHLKNINTAGANNLGVLIEDGHIGLLQTTAPTASVNTGCTACSAGTVMPHSTDVAGTITFNMGGSYGATFDFTVNYAKPYRKIPVVNITPANLVGGNVGKIYVQNLGGAGNYTGFRVFFIGGVSGGAGAAQFNYIVIEGSN